jgi:hypothetical protein
MSNQPQSPSIFRIHHLLAYQDRLLLVFYTPKGYEFRVFTLRNEILAGKHIFYTAEAALRHARDCLMDSWNNC